MLNLVKLIIIRKSINFFTKNRTKINIDKFIYNLGVRNNNFKGTRQNNL